MVLVVGAMLICILRFLLILSGRQKGELSRIGGLKQILLVWLKNSVLTLYLGFEVIASHYL